MMLFNRLGPGLAVGLDIGSSAIKLVELRVAGGEYHLQRLGIEPLPPEAIVEGKIMDSYLVVDAIHRLCDQTCLKNSMCATSVSGHSVIIKKIKVPAMPDEDLAESIQWEAEQYIPFDINDVRLDYVVLSRGVPGQDDMEILLTAVKRDKVNDYVSVISQAGRTPAIVDVDAFAVQNAYYANYDYDPGKVVALVNMGAYVTNINILSRNDACFMCDLSFGGNYFTEALQREFGLSFCEAEKLKAGELVDHCSAADALAVLNQVSVKMASEVSKAFNSFLATSSEGSVDELIISGGCALTPNITQILRAQLQLPTELMNPLRHIRYKESDFDGEWLLSVAPMMAVAVGLATRGNIEDVSLGRRAMAALRTVGSLALGVINSGKSPKVYTNIETPAPINTKSDLSGAIHIPRVTAREVEVVSQSMSPPERYDNDLPLSPSTAFSSAQRPHGESLESSWWAGKKQVADASPLIVSAPRPEPLADSGRSRLGSKVFISYAREDLLFAKRLHAELRAAGLDVWLDQEDLLPGQRWRTAITNAIYTSDCFIALLSSSGSLRRGYLHKELRQALDILEQMPEFSVFVIPARLDNCQPVHSALLEIHWVDLFPNWDEGMKRIFKTLENRIPPRRGRKG